MTDNKLEKTIRDLEKDLHEAVNEFIKDLRAQIVSNNTPTNGHIDIQLDLFEEGEVTDD